MGPPVEHKKYKLPELDFIFQEFLFMEDRLRTGGIGFAILYFWFTSGLFLI